MNLKNKKELAARTLNVGKRRITFLESRKDEIKEVITKQDIRDLLINGAIIIKEIKGRRRKSSKKKSKSPGKIRKNVKRRKRNYVIMTRKLRKYVKEIFNRGELNKDGVKEIRKKIRNKVFKSKSNLKKYMEELKK